VGDKWFPTVECLSKVSTILLRLAPEQITDLSMEGLAGGDRLAASKEVNVSRDLERWAMMGWEIRGLKHVDS
jgi:hypothetical protein